MTCLVLPRILFSQLFAIYDCLFFPFFLYNLYNLYDVIINKYSLPIPGPGADPGVQAVGPQVTL